jgi:O-antigen/teichoic acid export membrane protein
MNDAVALPLSFDRVKRVAREFFWVGLGQAIAAVGGLVGVSLLTRVLSPESYGELALGMTAGTLAQQVVIGPFAGAFLRFFAPAREARQTRAFLRAAVRLIARATAVLLAIALLSGIGFLVSGHGRWIGLLAAAFLFSLLSSYNSALDGIQNAARQRVVVAWHQGLGQWLRFLAALALVGWVGSTSGVAMFGYALGSALVLVSQSVLFRRQILRTLTDEALPDPTGIRHWTDQMRAYTWPFMTWAVFTWVQSCSDRWALQFSGATGDVGLYAALYQLGYQPLMLASGLLVQLVAPVIFSRAGDGTDPERLARSHRLNRLIFLGSLGLTGLGALVAVLFHDRIVALFVAPEYRVVSGLLPLMILAGGLYAAGQIAVLSLLSGVNSRALIAPKIVTALLGVALNFAGAFWFGLNGVVWAGVLFGLIYLVWIIFLTRRMKEPPTAEGHP